MASWLKQSTAVDIALGPFVDQTDGFTAETALTLAQADIRLKKNAGAWAQKSDVTSAVHEENGWYEVELDATDTNTLGILVVAVNESGALPVWQEFMVVPANVWDSYLAADFLQVDVREWIGTAAATPTVAGVPEVDVTHWIGTAAAAPTVAGVPEVDVTHWLGTAAATPTVAGVPEVDVTHVGGTVQTAGDIIGDTNDIQARLPAALVTGRIDASVGAMAADTVTASSLAADAGTEIADAILKRDMSAVTGEATRSLLNAIRKLRNKWSTSGATLTVTKEDDITTAYTEAITTDAAAVPIIGLDPN